MFISNAISDHEMSFEIKNTTKHNFRLKLGKSQAYWASTQFTPMLIKKRVYWPGLNRYRIIGNNANCIIVFLANINSVHGNLLIGIRVQRIKFRKANTAIAMPYKKHSDPWLTITALSRILPDFMWSTSKMIICTLFLQFIKNLFHSSVGRMSWFKLLIILSIWLTSLCLDGSVYS